MMGYLRSAAVALALGAAVAVSQVDCQPAPSAPGETNDTSTVEGGVRVKYERESYHAPDGKCAFEKVLRYEERGGRWVRADRATEPAP